MNVQITTLTTFLCFLFDFVLSQNDARMPPSIISERGTSSGRDCLTGEIHLITLDSEGVITINEDSRLELNCDAEGTPRVRYVWKKNGEDLNLSISKDPQSGNSFTINSVSAVDSGFYQCFASNQYGTALSTGFHIQIAILEQCPVYHYAMTVAEGRPFVIPAARLGSLQRQEHVWVIAEGNHHRNPKQLNQSQRLSFAFNGDLYFAYAVKEDGNSEHRYMCTASSPYTDYTSTTCATLTVINDTESLSEFLPNITYFSKSHDSALIGHSITLKCFFSGKPLPNIIWSRPNNYSRLASRRNSILNFGTELNILNITESDEGDYVCTATNAIGTTRQTLNFSVGAKPILQQDCLCNVNVTEGESITFNCSAYAKPEATVVWFQNGQPIDVENPPTRFVFSRDKRTLTIREVCRDCDDRESKTDLMVIQCNASNIHGYAFAQRYLNVLLKTNVAIIGPEKVSVDFLNETFLAFGCLATSDPNTTPIALWYKTEPYGDLVLDELPYVRVTKSFLVITFYPNCSAVCSKYLGEYKCIGDNGYSRDVRTITISYQPRVMSSVTGAVMQNEWPIAVWKIFLVAGAVCIVLFLIGMYLGSKRRIDSPTMQSRNRTLPQRPDMRDSVAHHAGSINADESSLPRALSVCDQIGYETIDQLLEEMGNRGGALPHYAHLTAIHEYDRYESIDAPQREVEGTGRPMLDEDITYDDTGFPITLEYVTNRDRMDKNQDHGYESVRIEARGLANSNTKFEAINTYMDLKSKEVNSCLNLAQKDAYPHLELGPEEMNPSSDVSREDVVHYMKMGKKDAVDTLYMSSDPTAKNIPCEMDYLALEN